jgi:Tol biopolymer transport system component
VAYVDWDRKADIVLHDLATGADRQLTNTGNDGPGTTAETVQYGQRTSFSKDGRQLAYAWRNGSRWELRVVSLQGRGLPASRRLVEGGKDQYIDPYDWSPDGRWISVALYRPDRAVQLALVSAADGRLRVLKSLEWQGTTGMFFSPDGRFLAYDAPTEGSHLRDVFVLAVDGRREIPAVVHPLHDVVLGWAPDGTRLIFGSDRSGSMSAWTVPFWDGTAQAAPTMLRPDIGFRRSMGITGTGALYTVDAEGWREAQRVDVRVASFDSVAGRLASEPVAAAETFTGSNQSPAWSPDGKFLAYVSRRSTIGGSYFVIGIRALDTGVLREVLPVPRFVDVEINHPFALRWASDGQSLVIAGLDDKRRRGLFRIDPQSGRTSALVTLESSRELGGYPASPAFSPDGRTLYYRHQVVTANRLEHAFVGRDLLTGEEVELIRAPTLGALHLAPNGDYIATQVIDPGTQLATLVAVPTGGGPPRRLLQMPKGTSAAIKMWAADSQSLFVVATEGTDSPPAQRQRRTSRVGLDGQRHDFASNLSDVPGVVYVHPSGQRLAFEVREPAASRPTEIWRLEHFLPPSNSPRVKR